MTRAWSSRQATITTMSARLRIFVRLPCSSQVTADDYVDTTRIDSVDMECPKELFDMLLSNKDLTIIGGKIDVSFPPCKDER